MTIAFNVQSAGSGSTSPITVSHASTGTARGALVFITSNTTTDYVTGVTYGGVTMSEVDGSPYTDATIPGIVHCYFLGSSVPTGTQDVVVTLSASVLHSVHCFTVTASDDTSVLTSATHVGAADAGSSVTDTIALGGTTAFVAEGYVVDTPTASGYAPYTGWTANTEIDFGAEYGGAYKYNTVGTADVTYGVTISLSTAIRAMAMAVALREGGGASPAVLSSATVASVTGSAATVGCTSDTASGTLYVVVTTSATQPSIAQIKAGQDHSGAAAFYSATDSTVAAAANTFNVTGMTSGLTYYAHFVQASAGGDSNRLTSAAVYPGTYRPASDITATGWSVTGAATHAAARAENTASDSEYSTSPTLSGTPVELVTGLDRVMAAGTYTVKYRCKLNSGSGFAKLTFYDADGTTARGNTGNIAITSTMTTYSVDVVLSGNAARVKEELWV